MAVINPGPVASMGMPGVPAFPSGAFAITPSNSDTFAVGVSVYVGVTGDVAVTPAAGGSNVTFVAVPAGFVVPLTVKAVLATGTTAASLVGIYGA